MCTARTAGNGPSASQILARLWPLTYSITRNGTPSSVSPTMKTVMMLGCESRAAARASRWKRLRMLESFIRSRRRTLIATSRSMEVCQAL